MPLRLVDKPTFSAVVRVPLYGPKADFEVTYRLLSRSEEEALRQPREAEADGDAYNIKVLKAVVHDITGLTDADDRAIEPADLPDLYEQAPDICIAIIGQFWTSLRDARGNALGLPPRRSSSTPPERRT